LLYRSAKDKFIWNVIIIIVENQVTIQPIKTCLLILILVNMWNS